MYGHTKFKSQITCYKYLGVGYKDLAFCRNNSLIMENMDKEFTVPKWANNTPNASKHFSPKCLPKPKSSRFLKKKLSLGVRSPWVVAISLTVIIIGSTKVPRF